MLFLDNNFDRLKLAYDAICYGKGKIYNNYKELIEDSYNNGKTDEFIIPALLKDHKELSDNDGVITFNFRKDRLRELFTLLSNPTAYEKEANEKAVQTQKEEENKDENTNELEKELEDFLSKYNNTIGLLADYDIENIKLVEKIDKTKVKINKHKLIREIITKDNNTIIGLFNFLWNNKNEVDDILVYIIPKNRMDLSYEEMYQLAFN